MIKTILGGLVGGVVLYLVGFLFWGTPLSGIAFTQAGEAQAAAVQQSLAQHLSASGTGTYLIPDASTQGGTVLYGQGPVATVHFNSAGFPVMDTGALITGLVMALVAGLLVAFALRAAADRGTDFAGLARLTILFALAITFYLDLGAPVFNHFGAGYFVFKFLSDFVGFAACGLVIARWFTPMAARSAEQR